MCTVTNRKGLLALGVVLFLLPILGAGCSPKIVERIVVQHDTTTVHHRDTTYHRDSIRVVRDSAVVEHIKEVKVEKNLSWSQKAKIGAFPWLLLALIGAVLWIFRKYLF